MSFQLSIFPKTNLYQFESYYRKLQNVCAAPMLRYYSFSIHDKNKEVMYCIINIILVFIKLCQREKNSVRHKGVCFKSFSKKFKTIGTNTMYLQNKFKTYT